MGSKRPKDSQLLTLSKLIEATYHEQGKLPPSQHNAFYNASATLVMDVDYLLANEDLPLTVSIYRLTPREVISILQSATIRQKSTEVRAMIRHFCHLMQISDIASHGRFSITHKTLNDSFSFYAYFITSGEVDDELREHVTKSAFCYGDTREQYLIEEVDQISIDSLDDKLFFMRNISKRYAESYRSFVGINHGYSIVHTMQVRPNVDELGRPKFSYKTQKPAIDKDIKLPKVFPIKNQSQRKREALFYVNLITSANTATAV